MARKEQPRAAREISASLKDEKYRVNIFFNRFSIEPLGIHRVIHFGLLVGHELLAHYAVVLEAEAMAQGRDSMLVFLDSLGEIDHDSQEQWRPGVPKTNVEVCNMVQMARTGDIGEIRLGVFSIGVAVDRARTSAAKVEVAGNPLALLRCDLVTQKLLLMQLYI